jgi:uncharacterized membrane protein YdjX (TVP38/TMEM64 family)
MINLFNLKNQITGYLIAIGGIIIAIFTVFMCGKIQGRQQAEAKQNEDIIRTQQKINDAGNLSSDDVLKRLRDGEF